MGEYTFYKKYWRMGNMKKKDEIEKAKKIIKESNNYQTAFHSMTDQGIPQSRARKYIRTYKLYGNLNVLNS
jgi:hypothetical protein